MPVIDRREFRSPVTCGIVTSTTRLQTNGIRETNYLYLFCVFVNKVSKLTLVPTTKNVLAPLV